MIPDSVWHKGEQYLSVKTHLGIFISIYGVMISFRRVGPSPKGGIMHRLPVVINGAPDQDGYLFITRPKRYVHEVVLTIWQQIRPSRFMQGRHLDGNKLNNRSSNLCWGTAKENGEDKAKHGKAKGSGNHQSKLSEQDVLNIRKLRTDLPLKEVCLLYPDISKFAVWAASTGYTWTHLPGAITGNRKCSKDAWRNGVKIRA